MNRVRFKNFFSKLSIKLVLLSLGSLGVGAIIFACLSNSYMYIMLSKENFNVNIYNMGVLSIFLIAIIISIVLFNLGIRRKLKYLEDISLEVVKIAEGKFGHQVKIEGNDEISKLVQNINFMSVELKDKFEKEKELENAKNELITNVSHDLRTPLTSIIGYIDLIKDKQYEDEGQFKQYLDIVSRKTENLRVMINDLFIYAKLTNKEIKLDFIEINLVHMLAQMLEEFIPLIESKDLNLTKEILIDEARVSVDTDKLVRVFENVISNAIKYSVKPGFIKVKVYKDNGYVVISIQNKVTKGSEVELSKLFERFYKSDKSRGKVEGSGLGLAIAKDIAKLHQGDIWAEIKENMIMFNVKIPLVD